ncbi:MAG: NTP transferase domain-containing protein [Euryarchaeota archaeon]|nr:NTP transferase domain-containing protein [Euryarchaeota archaeon]
MRAIILAAGEGMRLRPLTNSKPKVMIPVANRPILEYVVEALVKNKVKDITIVAGYRREVVQSYFEDGRRFDCKIKYVFQDSPIGTAHALSLAFDGPGESLVLGGDNIIDGDLVGAITSEGEGLRLAIAHSDNPAKYGVVQLSGKYVKSLEEKPREAKSDLVNAGVYVIPQGFRNLLNEAVKNGVHQLPDVIQAAIDNGEKVMGVKTAAGAWMDAVYPWDILNINAKILAREAPDEKKGSVIKGKAAIIRPTADVRGPTIVGDGSIIEANTVVYPSSAIGKNVTIGPACVIENSVIMDDAEIGPGSIIKNSVISSGVRTGPRFTAISGLADFKAQDGFYTLSDFGCVVGEDVVIGGNVSLEPGVVVGSRSTIRSNVNLSRSIPDSARVE